MEHNAICNNLVHDMFVKPVFAFGAKRWISSLERQCDRNATLLIHNKGTDFILCSRESVCPLFCFFFSLFLQPKLAQYLFVYFH